jgi:anti-sigma regulatory factor (Ser/Thr protein kinase)
VDAQRLGLIGRAITSDEPRAPRAHDAAWDLPADLRAPSRARKLTRSELAAWKLTDPGDIDDIVLIIDELVANAVVHAHGSIRLRLTLAGLLLRGEITDDCPTPAPTAPRAPRDVDAEDGRGLILVNALAAACGSTPHGPGKTVWFTRLLTGLAP